MTINVIVVTSDAVVLGCDSLSSRTDWALLPSDPNIQFATDDNGNALLDASGNRLIAFAPTNFRQIVVDVVGGVRKMFPLYERGETSVAAITSGLATLCGATVADIVRRYRSYACAEEFKTVESIAQHFLSFMRQKWEATVNYAGTPEDQRPFLPELEMLVAGFGSNDEFGRAFRVRPGENTCIDSMPDRAGVCWGGSANYVERILRGIDSPIQYAAMRQLAESGQHQRMETLRAVSEAMAEAGHALPEGLSLKLAEVTETAPPWDLGWAQIDYHNLPVQYAVEFAALLVNTQSGMQKFEQGIPHVGGRTHIGVIRRGGSFEALNEPDISHVHTGYANEH